MFFAQDDVILSYSESVNVNNIHDVWVGTPPYFLVSVGRNCNSDNETFTIVAI